MPMHIEIEDTQITPQKTRSGNLLRKQNICIWGDSKYPIAATITLDDDSPAYAEGNYAFAASSFVRSKFGGVELDTFNIKLEKLTDAQVKALAG